MKVIRKEAVDKMIRLCDDVREISIELDPIQSRYFDFIDMEEVNRLVRVAHNKLDKANEDFYSIGKYVPNREDDNERNFFGAYFSLQEYVVRVDYYKDILEDRAPKVPLEQCKYFRDDVL